MRDLKCQTVLGTLIAALQASAVDRLISGDKHVLALASRIPILTPAAAQFGIDPIQFGLIFVLNLMIGTITPPVGVVLFVTSKIARISFEAMSRAIVPWLLPLLAVLAAITLWPPLTTWLPQYVMGR